MREEGEVMKTLVRQSLVVLSLTVFLASCKNPLGGLSEISLNFRERAEVIGKLENADGLSTIARLRISWNGETLLEPAFSPPVPLAPFTATRYVPHRGSHRLSLATVDQTSSPNRYTVARLTISNYDEQGTLVETLDLEPKTSLLRTGEAISCEFRL